MLKEERQRDIIELLERNGKVLVSDLKARFKVTEMTIRRDLRVLEESGWIERIHGGALIAQRHKYRLEPPALERMSQMADEKQRIADYVAELIEEGEMIFLGSGTTTLYVARALADRDDLTIVSNALPIINELVGSETKTIIAVGGFIRRNELSMIGHFADAVLQDLRVDKVIMGMRGIHPDHGLTCDHPQELMTDRKIMEISDTVIIVADHTKIGHVATSKTASITKANLIVTTRQASRNFIQEIKKQNVNVIQV